MSEQNSYALLQQGEQYSSQGNYRQSIVYNEQALILARFECNKDNELSALGNMIIAFYNLGDFQKEIEYSTHLLVRSRQEQDEKNQQEAAFAMVVALARIDLRGRWQELKSLLLELINAFHARQDVFGEIYAMARLGRYEVRVGDVEQGFFYLQKALNLIQPLLDQEFQPLLLGEVYASISLYMIRRGNYAEAVRYAEMAVEVRKKDNQPQFVATAQLFLVRALLALYKRVEALQLLEKILALSAQFGWKAKEQEAAYLKGEIEREQGYLQGAEVLARHALKLAQEIKLKEEEVESLLSLGQILLALKQDKEANTVLKQARRLSQERNYDDHFYKAELLLQGVL